jgi:hypothetical protein
VYRDITLPASSPWHDGVLFHATNQGLTRAARDRPRRLMDGAIRPGQQPAGVLLMRVRPSGLSFLPFPPQPRAPIPLTLADLMAQIYNLPSLDPNHPSYKGTVYVNELCITAKRLGVAFGDRPQSISLEDLIRRDEWLITRLEKMELSCRDALHSMRIKNKLLEHAEELGWRPSNYKARLSWAPIRAVLRGNPRTIVDTAVMSGVLARRFTEGHLEVWRSDMRRIDRSPTTIWQAESAFRSEIRAAKLEHLLPKFSLKPRNRAIYAKDIASMTSDLAEDLRDKISWKVDKHVEGRDQACRIRPITSKSLKMTLRRICGFAESELGFTKILKLKEVLVPEVVNPMIEWMLQVRRNTPRNIATKMRSIHALLVQHPDYATENHSWLLKKIRDLPRESKWNRYARKNKKSISYGELALVPQRISQDLKDTQDTRKRAWLAHDCSFFTWLLHQAWRPRNLRECGLQEPRINLVEEQLPLDLEYSPNLPEWAKRDLQRDPHARFLQFVFREDETKGKRMVRGLVEPPLVKLYKTYLQWREILLQGHPDPGTLFFNRSLKPMRDADVRNLYAKLTEKYLRRRGSPHLNRDSVAAHHLAQGGSIASLQQKLWHRNVETTWEYCCRFNSSHGAVALERHLAMIGNGFQLNPRFSATGGVCGH